MAPITKTFPLTSDRPDVLEHVVAVLKKYQGKDYYAYERREFWYIGVGSEASLFVDAKGETATTVTEGKSTVTPITSIPAVARQFIAKYSKTGGKLFGQVGFNYSSHIRGQSYIPGLWPMVSIMAPKNEVVISKTSITVTGENDGVAKELVELLTSFQPHVAPLKKVAVDFLNINAEDYKPRVAKCIAEINAGKYEKAIISRPVDLDASARLDIPLTLLNGRRNNTPARSFALSHDGIEATGFSPELVLALEDGKLITQPLAGTRSREGTDAEIEALRRDLLSDPKEIVEHVISVMAAVEELKSLCPEESVVVEDLMSVRPRGVVQHLGSRVAGKISPGKDAWDAFAVLFPAITASGIPKTPALDAIQRIEERPRELYSGAVLLIEGSEFFEALLVLRSVFQDKTRGWMQAGAGVINASRPERELTETREKMSSVAPYLVGA